MRSVVIVLRNSKLVRQFPAGTVVPQVLAEIGSWLASAERTAREKAICVSFGVEVHLESGDCDHERPGVPQ